MSSSTNLTLKLTLAGILGMGLTGAAQAHITNWNLLNTATTVAGTGINADPCAGLTLCQSSANFSRYGWYDGTQSQLGDSHSVTFNAEAFTFHLASEANVTITDTAYGITASKLNPTFSVYSGMLPALSHDFAYPDEANPANLNGPIALSAMSPTDHAPGDPNIAHYLPNSDSTALVVNPAWTQTFDGSGGLTAEQWYTANYTPHNGYRDTLNGTQTGGIDTNPNSGNFGGLLNQYLGQFDAFGNWSMDNTGNWSQINYVSSTSATPCTGPNCVATTTGGFTNPGHIAGNNGNMETMILHLAAGDYSIFAGGESGSSQGGLGCIGVNGGADLGCSAGAGTFRAAISLQITAVPVPGAVWLFGSGLAGLGLFGQRKSSKLMKVVND